VPAGWILVPPGDPALTRRLKAAGPAWAVQEKKGRKLFSRGIWTLKDTVESVQAALAVERARPAYQKKEEAAVRRRAGDQTEYVGAFHLAVVKFLAFAPRHGRLAEALAAAVTAHATPVGSGTVARTRRIPIERRAAAAVIAWMRHHTTAYDQMTVPKKKGSRRELRRLLAARSQLLLSRYRLDSDGSTDICPLRSSLLRLGMPIGLP
jgi:hypothetical protein